MRSPVGAARGVASLRATLPVRASLAVAVAAFIVPLSIAPGVSMEGDSGFRWLVAVTPREVQNLLHLPSYGLLSGLWYWTLEPGTKGHWPKMAVAFTISAGLGTGLE